MTPTIVLTDTPDAPMRHAIVAPLLAFNEARAGRPVDYRPLVLLLTHPETGEILGGLWGGTDFTQLHVDLLFVPEALRGSGLGRRLMQQAEDEARRRGCLGAWLDTFSFQARGFYERLGYTVFGTIGDFPPGHSRLFLSKRFASLPASLPEPVQRMADRDREILVFPGTVFEESALMDMDLLAQTDPRRAQRIREALRSDACWIAANGDAVLGYAIRGEFFDHDFLQLLYVAAANRRRGVGHALMDALERACRSDCLFTSTNTSNAAMRGLLLQRGYSASGVVHNLTPDDLELIFMKHIEPSGMPA